MSEGAKDSGKVLMRGPLFLFELVYEGIHSPPEVDDKQYG